MMKSTLDGADRFDPCARGPRVCRAHPRVSVAGVFLLLLLAPRVTCGQIDFESEPINYNDTPATDRVSDLQRKIDRSEVKLERGAVHGYLRAVLKQLDVPVSSQVLVFSKTSFQQRLISARSPRALYFNDDIYVGWVQGSEVVELSTADPQLGAVFYTLPQEPQDKPRFVRDRGQCMTCHASSRTLGIPGHLVRSVYADRSGRPFFGSGTFTTDHRSPFAQRWGGWYVTGTHGKLRHMGNVTVTDRNEPERLDVEKGANVTDLNSFVNVKPYLSPDSDLVALMTLEHQVRMHNLITRLNHETRSAIYHDQIMNQALNRPKDYQSETTQRRIATAGDRLVEYMLFAEEFPLEYAVRGTSRFSQEFAQRGPHDSRGRSLRQFDLNTRLMKYPCSYLIYSKSFDGLPGAAKDYVYRRLWEILHEEGPSDSLAHPSKADRTAILEILLETKLDLPDYWKR